jgi:hypothetical protein
MLSKNFHPEAHSLFSGIYKTSNFCSAKSIALLVVVESGGCSGMFLSKMVCMHRVLVDKLNYFRLMHSTITSSTRPH